MLEQDAGLGKGGGLKSHLALQTRKSSWVKPCYQFDKGASLPSALRSRGDASASPLPQFMGEVMLPRGTQFD